MPTALELGPEGWKPFLEAARRRGRVLPCAEDEAARRTLLARAREAGRALKAEFGARRVVLFGSLAHGAWLGPASDVDLAVEGLPVGSYWRAWHRAEEFFPGRNVDFIEYEAASDSLRSAIDEEGLELP